MSDADGDDTALLEVNVTGRRDTIAEDGQVTFPNAGTSQSAASLQMEASTPAAASLSRRPSRDSDRRPTDA
jgi:hypothetical protein